MTTVGALFAWWMVCLPDMYGTAHCCQKPQVKDKDYDIDFYTINPIPIDQDGQTKPDLQEHLEVQAVYLCSRLILILFLVVLGMFPLGYNTTPVTI